jgi:hypothetical protein
MELSVPISPGSPFALSQFYCVTCLGTGVAVRALDDLHLLQSFQEVGSVEWLFCSSHNVFCVVKGIERAFSAVLLCSDYFLEGSSTSSCALVSLIVSTEEIFRVQLKTSLSIRPLISDRNLVVCTETNVVAVVSENLSLLQEIVLDREISNIAFGSDGLLAVLTLDDIQFFLRDDSGKFSLSGRSKHGMNFIGGFSVCPSSDLVVVWTIPSLGKICCFLGPMLMWQYQCETLEMLIANPIIVDCDEERGVVVIVTSLAIRILKRETGAVLFSREFASAMVNAQNVSQLSEVAILTNDSTCFLLRLSPLVGCDSVKIFRNVVCVAPAESVGDWGFVLFDNTFIVVKEDSKKQVDAGVKNIVFLENKVFMIANESVFLLDWEKK